MEFRAELQRTGGNTTGFEVPQEIVDGLGGGGRPKVVVRLNGYAWRSSIARMGGSYWLGVSAQNRAGAGVAGGDVVAHMPFLWASVPTTTPRSAETLGFGAER
jgi:Domain of unknown function (DUF1905)